MQVWNQVKVNDPDSPHVGMAGLVQAVKQVKGKEICSVKLDGDEGEVVDFNATQLQYLG